jgi:hypothetical protein
LVHVQRPADCAPGESTILALVTALRDGTPLTEVPGLVVWDDDGVALRTPAAPQLPLDAFETLSRVYL